MLYAAAVLSAQVVAEQLLALDRVLIDRPERRSYFYDGRPLDAPGAGAPAAGPTPETRGRALALAELMLGHSCFGLSRSHPPVAQLSRAPGRL